MSKCLQISRPSIASRCASIGSHAGQLRAAAAWWGAKKPLDDRRVGGEVQMHPAADRLVSADQIGLAARLIVDPQRAGRHDLPDIGPIAMRSRVGRAQPTGVPLLERMGGGSDAAAPFWRAIAGSTPVIGNRSAVGQFNLLGTKKPAPPPLGIAGRCWTVADMVLPKRRGQTLILGQGLSESVGVATAEIDDIDRIGQSLVAQRRKIAERGPARFKPIERVGEITMKRVVPSDRHAQLAPTGPRPIARRQSIGKRSRLGQPADPIQIAHSGEGVTQRASSQPSCSGRSLKRQSVDGRSQGRGFFHRAQDRYSPKRFKQRLDPIKLRLAGHPIQQHSLGGGPARNAASIQLRHIDHRQPRQFEPVAERFLLAPGRIVRERADLPFSITARRPSVVPRSSSCRQASGVISQLSKCRLARPVITVAPSRGAKLALARNAWTCWPVASKAGPTGPRPTPYYPRWRRWFPRQVAASVTSASHRPAPHSHGFAGVRMGTVRTVCARRPRGRRFRRGQGRA